MIGDAVLYAVSRAMHNAIDNVSRRATWTGIALAFFAGGFVFALMLAFWYAAPRIGTLHAAAAITIVCFGIGAIALAVPSVVEWMEKRGNKDESAIATTLAVAQEEAHEAVDYFGPTRLIGAAFLFGLGAARRLKSKG